MSRDFHALDVDRRVRRRSWLRRGATIDHPEFWASCACGWVDGPHQSNADAKEAWTEHLRPALRAVAS